VTGSIFGYYLDDLRGRLDARKNIWRIVSVVLVVGSIVAGFSVLGSPQTQRLVRYDSQKVSDLQNIQWQIVNYWQQKGSIPTTLAELGDPISGFSNPLDPQTKTSYEYEKTGNVSFNLCATFNKSSKAGEGAPSLVTYPESRDKLGDNWQHEAGRQCFERTIDAELYPVRPK